MNICLLGNPIPAGKVIFLNLSFADFFWSFVKQKGADGRFSDLFLVFFLPLSSSVLSSISATTKAIVQGVSN